ncbi:hypothetical protein F2Q70_00037115 [Brassica cretica]|uniref:Uncharacterized protein n=1 Tax=Brassica cretica TaxID=69181 RepID=A0A8S9JM79_BRACR|nr:hypothetical protein F2Q70_00037115 [Brassica cretica]KAF3529386.1 hypothetical protein DY000_02042698 [Brassica cretica]
MILKVLCHCDIIVNQKTMILETELWHQEDRGSLNLNLVFSVILNSIAVSAGKTSCIIWIFTNRIETDCLQSLGVEDVSGRYTRTGLVNLTKTMECLMFVFLGINHCF